MSVLLLTWAFSCKEPAGKPPSGSEPAACDEGDWGGVADEAGTLYVRAGESGSGTCAAPFGTLTEAVAAATAQGEGRIVVGAGTYVENVEIAEGVVLDIVGAGAEEVILDGSAGAEDAATLDIAGTADVTLAGVTVTGAPEIGVLVKRARLALADTVITANGFHGLSVQTGAEVTVSNVEVSGTYELEQGGGYGVIVAEGTLEADDLRVSGNTSLGFGVAFPGATATLRSSSIEGTLGGIDNVGWGAWAYDGGTLLIEDSVLTGNVMESISCAATTNATSVTVRRTTIADTVLYAPDPETFEGAAVSVSDGCVAVLDEVQMERNPNGIVAFDADVTVTTATITAPESDALIGVFGEGGTITLEDVAITGAFGSGIAVGGTTVEAADVSIVNGSDTDAESWYGIWANYGSAITLTDVSIAEVPGNGIYLWDSSLTATGLTVTDIRPTIVLDLGTLAQAIAIGTGAVAAFTDLEVSGAEGVGVSAAEGAEVRIDGSSRIADVTSPGEWFQAGFGVAVFSTGTATSFTADGLSVEDCEGVGIGVVGPGADAVLTDVTVSDIGTGRLAAGFGIEVTGTATLSGVTITDVEGTALLVDGDEDATTLGQAAVTATDLAIAGITSVDESPSVGVTAQRFALFEGTGVMVEDVSSGPAIYAVAYAAASCDTCDFATTGFAGAVVQGGASVELVDVSIDQSEAAGRHLGLFVSSDIASSTLTMTGGAITGTDLSAVYIKGDNTVTLDGVDLEAGSGDTIAGVSVNGNAVYVVDATVGPTVTDCFLHGSASAAVLVEAATATLCGNTFSDNAVDVGWQPCDGTEPEVCDGHVAPECQDPALPTTDPGTVDFVFTVEPVEPVFE